MNNIKKILWILVIGLLLSSNALAKKELGINFKPAQIPLNQFSE